MSNLKNHDNQPLSDTVARLDAALAHSEQRMARFERMFRWGAIAFVLCIGMIISIGSSSMNKAFAQLAPSGHDNLSQGETVVDALNKINASMEGVRMMGMMMKMGMQAAITEAMTAPEKDPECTEPDTVLLHNLYCYAHMHTEKMAQQLDTPMDQLTREQRIQFAQEAAMTAAGSVMVDMGILTHRIKQDSDLWRTEGLTGIQAELRKLNNMVTAIPIMASEMGAMNRQMSVMSHGVGSTMGRMGSWMPW